MKQLFALFFAVLLVLTASRAEERTNEFKLSGTLSTMLQENYVGLRISRNIHDGWMLWSDLYVNAPHGFFVDLWHSVALENRRSKAGDEFDVTLGWKHKLPHGLDFEVSTALFNLYPLGTWWDGDVAVQEISLSKSFAFGDHLISPEIAVDWMSKTSDFGGGSVILMPNISHLWESPFGRVGLAQRVFLVWDDGFDGSKNDSEGIFFRWSAGLNWKLTKNLTWTMPGFTALLPLTRGHDGRKQETSWNTSLTLGF